LGRGGEVHSQGGGKGRWPTYHNLETHRFFENKPGLKEDDSLT